MDNKKLVRKVLKIFSLIILGIVSVLLLLFLYMRIIHFYRYANDKYYYDYYDDSNAVRLDEQDNINNSDNYSTVIDHTTKYINQNIYSRQFASSLIAKESLKQEDKCNNDLGDIEQQIKRVTDIYGINLCEISMDDANNLLVVLKKIYMNYPFLKGYVTNITIVNDGGVDSYIAAFKPTFTFATSNSENKFPFIIKVQVFLNSSYYLNDDYFKLVIKNAVSSGHFPKDTTKYSLIAHEFGHVITYVLAINYYNSMNTLVVSFDDFSKYASTLREYSDSKFAKIIFDESYINYKGKYGNISEENFISNISGYANSYDSNGNIMYNETIAEAFHDYYMHGDEAKKESLEIMNVINKYIKEVM